MDTENSAPSATSSPAEKSDARKGFHPLLIVATLAIIVFTLWFCPRAFRWAAEKSTARAADNLDKYLPQN